MARPHVPKAKQKVRQFNFRLSEDEFELIRQAAGDYPPTTWARAELLRLARKEIQKLKRRGSA